MMNDLSKKLFRMCIDSSFDRAEAENLVRYVELNREYEDPQYPKTKTTFLSVAVMYANITMVQLLLENGADPNFILYEDKPLERGNPFWDLQYNDFGATPEENEIGLQMTQLMLEHGANPLIKLDGEDLFSYVCSAVFNDDDTIELWRYRSRFFILMIAYGGSSDYCQPVIIKEFDKDNMEQYEFALVPCSDGYHFTGVVLDCHGEVVAKV